MWWLVSGMVHPSLTILSMEQGSCRPRSGANYLLPNEEPAALPLPWPSRLVMSIEISDVGPWDLIVDCAWMAACHRESEWQQ